MNLLLDTHIAIWAMTERKRIRPDALKMMADANNQVFVSAATIWEIAIKFPLTKRHGAPPFSAAEARHLFAEARFTMLDITPAHAATVETLPALHGDPFDRLLVAQALSEPMRLLTADVRLATYSDLVTLAG